MEDGLLKSWEIQKEGVEEISSDSGCCDEILDIYGRELIIEDDSNNNEMNSSIFGSLRNEETRYQLIFHRWVLLGFCLFVPIICTIIVLIAIRKNQQCGLECVFALNGSGWFIIPMMLLFFCDIIFLISGIIYHLNVHSYYCCYSKWKQRNSSDFGHEGVVEIERELEGP
eukprot:UN00352